MKREAQRIWRRSGCDGAARFLAVAAVCSLMSCMAYGDADAHRGLWVGQVTLTRVNEVSVPLDEDNVAIAPDPELATPTADAAHLRLILHVSGSGQVSLLKDVAILARSGDNDSVLAVESDMALVTDERLYGEVPSQPAVRIASAAFSFGDSRATAALDAVRDAAAQSAADEINKPQLGTQEAAEAKALTAAQGVIDGAAIASRFDAFLRDSLASGNVDSIATSLSPETEQVTIDARAAAFALLDSPFYADARASNLVEDLVGVATNSVLTNDVQRLAAAHAVASSFADVADNYHRFIGGKIFGDMIMACANAGYTSVTNPAATESDVRTAVEAAAGEAFAEALRVKVSRYSDSRGRDAVQAIVDAIVDKALEAQASSEPVTSNLETELAQEGHVALATKVARYAVPGNMPTPDYNAFVTRQDFLDCASMVAAAAAEGAYSEREDNSLFTTNSVRDAALLAAANVLGSLYEKAALAVRTSLPLEGFFGPGQGDPRLTWEIKENGEDSLRPDAALTGQIYLPARHPTNPFRHRRHPDHTAGFNIVRRIRIDFEEASTNALERVGFGVDRITGTYREEIDGLHKLLGPDKNIGLKTEGTFELNRISLIDTLNAL